MHTTTANPVGSAAAAVGVVFVAIVGAAVAVPAYAKTAEQDSSPASQTLTVSGAVPSAVVSRDSYQVTSPLLVWPVPRSTPIASPFGPRVSPCDGCSSIHEGADLDAGYGAEVHAIAAGVVVETDEPGRSSLGTHLTLRHVIDGRVVVSVYGHLIAGSMPLHVGETVYAGEVIGLVGDTGESTGPHLHVEIRLNGATPTDPVAWLRAHLG